MDQKAVVGLGFGDEGKGAVTSYLVSKAVNPLVVRFNGGGQAGHTVVRDGVKHVFSNFGSGTLHGAPTFWSHFCTFDPLACAAEYEVLKKLNVTPKLYVDPNCPVILPHDINHNRDRERACGHGTCGVGFGAAIERHEKHYKVYAKDLLHPEVLSLKIEQIESHYYPYQIDIVAYLEEIKKIIHTDVFSMNYPPYHQIESIIYEGAQGILLDQNHGFFPNVTRSNTTTENTIHLRDGYGTSYEVYYVSRLYHTRHGNGPLMNEDNKPALSNTEGESNCKNEFQGNFRICMLDVDLLKYSYECNPHRYWVYKNLVFTCADQFPNPNKIPVTAKGGITIMTPMEIAQYIGFSGSVYLNSSPEANLQRI